MRREGLAVEPPDWLVAYWQRVCLNYAFDPSMTFEVASVVSVGCHCHSKADVARDWQQG